MIDELLGRDTRFQSYPLSTFCQRGSHLANETYAAILRLTQHYADIYRGALRPLAASHTVFLYVQRRVPI